MANSTIKFWAEMTRVQAINALDKVMLGINSTGEAQYTNFADLKNAIGAISGAGFYPPVQPGGTLGNPSTISFTFLAPGSYNGGLLVVPDNTLGLGYWNGSSWSLTTIPLPQLAVVNNLTSTSITSALSANQGRVLNESKEPSINKKTTINNSDTEFPTSKAVLNYGQTLMVGKENSTNKKTTVNQSDIEFPTSFAVIKYVSGIVREYEKLTNKKDVINVFDNPNYYPTNIAVTKYVDSRVTGFSNTDFGGVIDSSKDLSNPKKTIWYFARAGTYNTNPPITLTSDLSILTWDKVKWTYAPLNFEITNDFIVFNTMAEFRSMNTNQKLAISSGAVKGVLLNGYYSKGDVSQKYYYLSTSTDMDNGGSIIEIGSLKLEHVFNNYLSYNDFGAKLTLPTASNDWDCIKKAHDYANSKGIKVIQSFGDIYPQYAIDVKTTTDLTGINIHITDTIANKSVFNIISDNDWVTKTITNQSTLVKKLDRLVDFVGIDNALVNIKSNEILCQRTTGGTTSTEYKDDIVYVGVNGYLVNSVLIHDFTTGNLTVSYKKCNDESIIVTGINILWELTNANSWCQVLNISRSNTTLSNVNNVVNSQYPINPSIYRRYLINIFDCYNFTAINIDGLNISTATTGSAYIISMTNVVRSLFSNLLLIRGWGAFGTNRVKSITIKDSTINRFDVHLTGSDIFMSNVTFIGGWGVLLGYGMGNATLNNCTSDYSNIDGKVSDYVVRSAGTYGLWFAGDVHITNHTIITKGTGSKKLLSVTIDDLEIDYKEAYNVETPSLYADNIKFNNISGESLTAYDIQDGRLYYLKTTLEANNKKLVMPKNINVRNVFKDVDDDNSYTRVCFIEVPNQITGYVKGNTNIFVDNVKQDIHSYHKTNIPTSYAQATVLKPLVYFSEIRSDAGISDHRLTIQNSDGGVKFYGRSQSIKISNSSISYADWYSSVTYPSIDIDVRDCLIYPLMNAGKTAYIIKNTTLSITDSLVHLATYNSLPLPVTFTGTFIYAKDSYFGGSFTSVTAEQVNLMDRSFNNSRIRTNLLITTANTTTSGTVKQATSLPITATMEQLINAMKTAGLMAT